MNKKALQSNSNKLTGGTTDTAIEVEEAPVIRREESEDELDLQDLPVAEDFPAVEDVSDISEAGSLFVDEDEDRQTSKRPRAATDGSAPESPPSAESHAKRRKNLAPAEEGDDKKKMLMDTTYEGFAIYGQVLCLVVKRKDKKGLGKREAAKSAGQVMMEDWISSTQMPPDEEDGS